MRKLSQQARELIKEYGLIDDPKDPGNSDVFHSSRFSIITRGGIDKISSKANISSILDVVYSDPYEVVIKGIYSDQNGRTVTTFGESTVDQYGVDKLVQSSFNKGALGLIRDSALLIKDYKGGEDSINLDSLQRMLASLSSLNAVESSEVIQKTLIKKGNVTSTNSSGVPIPNYRWAMAEKRANSRGILKLAGFYDEGFFGEEEADDFGKVVKDASSKKSSASKVTKESVKTSV